VAPAFLQLGGGGSGGSGGGGFSAAAARQRSGGDVSSVRAATAARRRRWRQHSCGGQRVGRAAAAVAAWRWQRQRGDNPVAVRWRWRRRQQSVGADSTAAVVAAAAARWRRPAWQLGDQVASSAAAPPREARVAVAAGSWSVARWRRAWPRQPPQPLCCHRVPPQWRRAMTTPVVTADEDTGGNSDGNGRRGRCERDGDVDTAGGESNKGQRGIKL
jgi:hypothetical protein